MGLVESDQLKGSLIHGCTLGTWSRDQEMDGPRTSVQRPCRMMSTTPRMDGILDVKGAGTQRHGPHIYRRVRAEESAASDDESTASPIEQVRLGDGGVVLCSRNLDE